MWHSRPSHCLKAAIHSCICFQAWSKWLRKARPSSPAPFGLQLPAPLPCVCMCEAIKENSTWLHVKLAAWRRTEKLLPQRINNTSQAFFVSWEKKPFMYGTQVNVKSLASWLPSCEIPVGAFAASPGMNEPGASTAQKPLLWNLHWYLLFIDSCHTSTPNGELCPWLSTLKGVKRSTFSCTEPCMT